jgi:tRNA pseudouridine55 synthase
MMKVSRQDLASKIYYLVFASLRENSFLLDGILPIYKPAGMVSKNVSRYLQKFLGKVKLGHVGTLDPMAEGVLPILLGKATKVQDRLLDSLKCYEFEMQLGISTDSGDMDGEVIKTLPCQHVPFAFAEEMIRTMVGEQVQIPPLYSAVKFKGRPLYDYARKSQTHLIDWTGLSRQIYIKDIDLLVSEGTCLSVRVFCSKGTYVRTLAERIGESLGTCAMVTKLVRRETAGFSLEETVSLETLKQSWLEKQTLSPHLISVEQHMLKLKGELI